jgi:hypothetical protein
MITGTVDARHRVLIRLPVRDAGAATVSWEEVQARWHERRATRAYVAVRDSAAGQPGR